MQAFSSVTKLATPARHAMKIRRFGDSSNPASKNMSKANFAGEKVSGTQKTQGKSPFTRDEDLHGSGLDEQTKQAMLNSVFPHADKSSSKQDGLHFTKDEQKAFNNPVRSGIDKLAEGVESRGAEASQNFTASRSTTNAAANFANGADNAARSGDKIRQNVQGAHDKLSDVGKRIAEMSHAPSIGNDPSSGVKTTTATMGEGEDETRTKDGAMSSGVTGAMASGMEKLTDKMSNMGSSIAEKMKPLEGLADSMATPHMPKVVENLKETVTSTVSSATEKVKQAMPHSIDEAKDAIAKKMPSMDSVKSAVNSVKDSMPSMPKSVNDAKEAVSKSMPSMNDAKNAAAGAAKTATDTAKSAASTVSHSMPSMETAKDVASHKMEEGKETLKRSADYVKDKASEATHMAKDAATGPTAASVIDQFKQGVQTMKEAMKPIVNTATEKIKEGAHIAAEKIPPMASSIKDNVKTGAAAVMNSSTVESIKDTVTSAAKGTYEKAKDAASSAVTGKSDAAKMNIKEDTTKVSKSKLEAKDQEMSSSDIYKA